MIHKCPICKAPTDSDVHRDFPFCGGECRTRDLGNWATEKYVVSEPIFDEDDLMEAEPAEHEERTGADNDGQKLIH